MRLHIDIVSDVVCPWCIVGFKSLELALLEQKGKIEWEIQWHPFQLNPQMPSGGQNIREHLAEKYGTTTANSAATRKHLEDLGSSLGFVFDFDDAMRIFNTFKAHQLLNWAQEFGKQHELQMRLFSAYFTEHKAIDQIDVLVQEAVQVGLDENQARSVLKSDHYAEKVQAQADGWTQAGIRSVPTFIFEGKYMASGAQDLAGFRELISKVVERQTYAPISS